MPRLRLILRPDIATMRGNDATADGKAEAGAFLRPMMRRSIKLVEYLLFVARGNAGAVIGNAYLHHAVLRIGAYGDGTARGGIFSGILKKVGQDLL